MILDKVVVISKEAQVQQLARHVARQVYAADNLAEALDLTEANNPQLALFDQHLGQDCLREFLKKTDNNSRLNVVVIGPDKTQHTEPFEQTQVADYISRTDNQNRLKEIAAGIKDRNTTKTSVTEEDTHGFFAEEYAASVPIVGRSKAIMNSLKTIKLVAASRCNPVLVVGETGTGKELAAKAVHTLRSAGRRFVAVNCAALTANLLESELFGHVKGAFTGADREKTGLFELAGTGSIFLDEISEMPIDLQAKLLRVLQEKTFRKVGGTKDIICRATIIASTNRDLKEQVRENKFRQDLFYRLNICPVSIAPLRAPERKNDIELLATYFLKSSTICPDKTKKVTAITKLAMEALHRHDWPGNVRELQNVIERAILLETTNKIGLTSIVIDPLNYSQSAENSVADQAKDFSLAKAERELIARALKETGWQKTQAASLLNITRATLYAKIKHYNIEEIAAITKPRQPHLAKSSSPEPVTVP